ncbi:MAG: helix-turn-helix transcriptional regulator [Spirochaetes bacterium]|nr:helix-turn-helix transcriptional regulator [Spirochaetota bacterium]
MHFRSGISDHFMPTPGAFSADLKLFAFAITKADKAFTYARHTHTSYELVYVAGGTYRSTVNDVSLTLKPGHALAIKPGDTHEDICAPGLTYYSVKIAIPYSADTAGSIFADGITPADQCVKVPRALFDRLTSSMEAEAKRGDEIAMHIIAERSKELFWQMMRSYPARVLAPAFIARPAGGDFTAQLHALFARSLAARLSVQAMADNFGMSESTFFQHCARVLGVGPAKAFANYRLDRARTMLIESDDYIRDIASRCGFINQFHFSRIFASVYGASPQQYRRMTRKK